MASIYLYYGDPSLYIYRRLVTPYGSTGSSSTIMSIGKVCGPIVSIGGGTEELGFSNDPIGVSKTWDVGEIIGPAANVFKTETFPWGWSILGRSAIYWYRSPEETFNYDQDWTWYFQALCHPADFSEDPWMRLTIQEDIPLIGWTTIFNIDKKMTVDGYSAYSVSHTPSSGSSNSGPNQIRGLIYCGWFSDIPT
jgi:hypothetical protein